MGYGYALLPTADEPTSDITFRLTPAEKRERDEWIMGAVERKWSISEIAYEVGLTTGRVSAIVKKARRIKRAQGSKNVSYSSWDDLRWVCIGGGCREWVPQGTKYCDAHQRYYDDRARRILWWVQNMSY